jgi:hypothetical protein
MEANKKLTTIALSIKYKWIAPSNLRAFTKKINQKNQPLP